MSPELVNRLTGIGGIVGGLLLALAIMFLAKGIASKQHSMDERYLYCLTKAKAFSWKATTISLALAWIIAIAVDGISLSFFIITALFVLHNVSYLAANLYYSARN
ncbi:hypothetical protein PAECIP112173_02979 [Paenibacillus sp. JJ-100]|uniref:hypothetical protein n=1 Tax=Paenibacillus sp. JJ-100 TaxID=2974896 RepID=UPI0022FF71CC|nr:hypothetical protein [Paenibacillus sp. JJ-100]CAI6080717.1 hypothetical protein PAECIP112173_02979 [Paenibacillus sp. JJ-100]